MSRCLCRLDVSRREKKKSERINLDTCYRSDGLLNARNDDSNGSPQESNRSRNRSVGSRNAQRTELGACTISSLFPETRKKIVERKEGLRLAGLPRGGKRDNRDKRPVILLVRRTFCFALIGEILELGIPRRVIRRRALFRRKLFPLLNSFAGETTRV